MIRSPCWLMSSSGINILGIINRNPCETTRNWLFERWRKASWLSSQRQNRLFRLTARSRWVEELCLCPFWRSHVHSKCSEFATSSHWSICDDCCICPQMTWQFMFLDNTFKSKKPAFLEHRNHPLHITFWRLVFSLQASAQPAWRFRFDAWMNIHPSYGPAMGWTGWVWTAAIAMKNKIRWVHFQGRIQNLSDLRRKWTKSACHGQQPLHRTPARLLSRCAFCVPLASTHWNIIGIQIPSCCISKVYHPSNINRATLPDRGLMDWKWLEDNLLFQKNAGSQHQTVILGQSSH